jgi:hypothetical protein
MDRDNRWKVGCTGVFWLGVVLWFCFDQNARKELLNWHTISAYFQAVGWGLYLEFRYVALIGGVAVAAALIIGVSSVIRHFRR